MQVLEFSKGAGFALGVVLAVESPADFLVQMREIKAALLNWRSKHGDRCELVMFTITALDGKYDEVAHELDRVYREEAELSPLLQRLQVQVALLSRGGRAVKEYHLGQPIPLNRPWWKFW
jgi:hypothetical protein